MQGGVGQTQGELEHVALPAPEDVLLEKKGRDSCQKALGANPKGFPMTKALGKK